MALVLASKSASRRMMLDAAGVAYRCQPADIDERAVEAEMGTVPPARAGMASATSNTMRQVGGVFGIAVLGNLVTHTFTSDLSAALAKFRLPAAVDAKIMAMAGQGRESASGHAIPGVDMAALSHTINQSFTNGIHAAMWVSGIMLLVGAPIAFLTVRYTAPHHVEARQAKAAEFDAAAEAAGAAAALAGPAEGAG